MDNSPHKGVYQLNYADILTTKRAWNVAMVICVTQVRRERLKIEALITVWMQCSIHGTLCSLTSRSVVLEPTGNNNSHNKVQIALCLVEKACYMRAKDPELRLSRPANIVCFTCRVPPTHLLCRFLGALQQNKAQSKLLYLLSAVMEDFKLFLANQQCINQIKKFLGLEK